MPDPADILRQLRASHAMLMQTPEWAAERHTVIFKVYGVAAMLLAGSKGHVWVHPTTIADAVGATSKRQRETVRDALRRLDAAGVLSWTLTPGSTDQGLLAFAPEPPDQAQAEEHERTPSTDEVIARQRARAAAQAAPSNLDAGHRPTPPGGPELARQRTALEAFGEAEPSYLSDRERPRG